MDGLSFTSSVVSSLAWPVGALGIAAILRRDISGLLRRLKLFRGPGGWEAEFDELDKVREQADQLLVGRAVAGAATTPSSPRGRAKKTVAPALGADAAWSLGEGIGSVAVDRLLQLADIAPSAAVTEAWSTLERELVKQARDLDVVPRDAYMPVYQLIPALSQKSERVASVTPLLNQLRRIRNNAAHPRDEAVSRDGAVDYVLTAARVLMLLRLAD